MLIEINKLLKLKIRSKLIIAFTALAVLPVLIVGITAISSNVKSLRKISENNLTQDILQIKKDLDVFYNEIEDKLYFIVSSPFFDKIISSSIQDNKSVVHNLTIDFVPEITALTRNKNIIYQIKLIRDNGDEIFVLENKEGKYRILPDSELEKTRSLFYLYIVNKNPVSSSVFVPGEIKINNGKKILNVISCIYRFEKGNFRGVLILQIYAKSFFKIIEHNEKNSLTPMGKIQVVNSDGYFIYHSENQEEWDKLTERKGWLNFKKLYGVTAAKKILSGNSDEVIEIDSLIVAFSNVLNSESGLGTKYKILKSVSKSEIFKPISLFYITFWGLLGLFTLLSVYFGFVATQQFIIPIKKLHNEVEDIAGGNYSSRVVIKTYDEIEELAGKINILAESLEEHNNEIAEQHKLLEYKVHERTKELEAEKNKLQIIFDNLPSGFLLIDKFGKIISTSAYMKILTGKRVKELIGYSCSEILPCCENYGGCRALETFELVESREQTKKFLTEFKDKLLEHTILPIKKDGNIESVLEIITDITESKRLRDHLIRSEKLATTGEMSAIVAHEIRNSLTSVRMILQLISRSKPMTSEDRESYDVALDSISKMERVVEDLLKIARPTRLDRKPSKVKDILMESLKLAEHQIKKKKIEIILLAKEENDDLLLDNDRLKEAFINLILNATQAIEETGQIIITSKIVTLNKDLYDLGEIIDDGESAMVTLQDISLLKGSSVIMIEISDTGSGINEDIKERIFDAFFTTKVNGTGLGLSLVKRVINQHGGIISVESEPGQGSKFTIFIPKIIYVQQNENLVR